MNTDQNKALKAGMKVMVPFDNSHTHYEGTIRSINADGTYVVHFEDDNKDYTVLRDNIKLLAQVSPLDKLLNLDAIAL